MHVQENNSLFNEALLNPIRATKRVGSGPVGIDKAPSICQCYSEST